MRTHSCWFILLFSMTLIVVIGNGQTTYPEVAIPGTQMRLVHSEITGQDLELCIQLPWTYDTRKDSTYAVLYCLDANRAFPLVANIARVTETPGFGAQEKIIVGIGYKIGQFADWAAWRTRDLTPTRDTAVQRFWEKKLSRMTGKPMAVESGGATKFLECIQKEVIPFVESNYRASHTDRCLAGYSYGGLFALYALFHAPDTFTRWLAGSPSLEWDNGIVFHDEEIYAASHTDLPVRLFMTVGALEDSTTKASVARMADRLRARGYKGLQLRTIVFAEENHTSCMAAAIARAMRVLYEPRLPE